MSTADPRDNQPATDLPEFDGVPHTTDSHELPDAAAAAPLPSAELLQAKSDAKKIEHSRSKATYFAWAVGLIVLIGLLVFILRNQDSQEIDLLFWTVNLPVGVSLLIAAIAGAIITLAISATRIIQLRRALKKLNKAAR